MEKHVSRGFAVDFLKADVEGMEKHVSLVITGFAFNLKTDVEGMEKHVSLVFTPSLTRTLYQGIIVKLK